MHLETTDAEPCQEAPGSPSGRYGAKATRGGAEQTMAMMPEATRRRLEVQLEVHHLYRILWLSRTGE